MEFVSGGITAPKGFWAGGVRAGIKPNAQKEDLALIYSEAPCAAAAVYTQNRVQGAPIAVTKRNLANGRAQAVIVNSGNANTCNPDGEEKAQRMCGIAAEQLGIPAEDVIVASTGVIGQKLPMEPIEGAAAALKASLSRTGSGLAARAIMTTDTVPKEAAAQVTLGGRTVTVGGIAKGCGMIHPNMATMLCFLATDCAIAPELLQTAVRRAADETFNMISVDGDTSTNDTFAVLANGLAGNPVIAGEDEDFAAFTQALTQVARALAKKMAGDGEGATKLLICRVTGAKDTADARKAAKAVICSSLVKAAMFGEDANCGRVLCAVGYSGAQVDVGKIDVAYESANGEIAVCRDGCGLAFDEELAARVLHAQEITVAVTLHDGDGAAEAYGCDLTYDYVKINGDYRT